LHAVDLVQVICIKGQILSQPSVSSLADLHGSVRR
jgi:hypothetical protein